MTTHKFKRGKRKTRKKMPLPENILRADHDGGEAGRLRLLDCGVAGQPASWNIIDTYTWGRCGAWLLLAPELNCYFPMND